jgi:antitoxin (DNA-binding transcriptional repressor) of toxin-antitoxin stability system
MSGSQRRIPFRPTLSQIAVVTERLPVSKPAGARDIKRCPHMTMYDDYGHMPLNQVSKASFKAHALEIFRRVQETGEAVLITDRGRPVLRLEPYYGEDDAVLASLRDSVIQYRNPTQPVGEDAWEAVG